MDYKGIVATIIAGTLGASLMLAVVSISWQHRPLGDKGNEAMVAIISGMLVALGYYMGGRNGKE